MHSFLKILHIKFDLRSSAKESHMATCNSKRVGDYNVIMFMKGESWNTCEQPS
jgi:hypothetical protein